MFEPGSVMSDVMQLSLLLGEKQDKNCNWVDVAPPSAFQHAPFSGTAVYPDPAPVVLAATPIVVPDNKILIVTFAAVYVCQTDETVNSVDFGVNHQFFAWWQTTLNGTDKAVTPVTGEGQGIINRPVLLIFPEKVTVSLMLESINSNLTDGDRTLLTTVTAYTAPSALTTQLSKNATNYW